MTISVPLIIIFGFFTKQVLLIYNIDSQYLIICMWILLLTNIFLIGSSLGSVFSAYNRPELISLFLVLGSVLNLILSLFKIKVNGNLLFNKTDQTELLNTQRLFISSSNPTEINEFKSINLNINI